MMRGGVVACRHYLTIESNYLYGTAKNGIESLNSKPTVLENQREECEDTCTIMDEQEAFYHATS